MGTFLFAITAVIAIVLAIVAEYGDRKFRTQRFVASFLVIGVLATAAGIYIHKSQSQKPSESERHKIYFDNTRRFQDKFLPGGKGIISAFSYQSILVLKITDELAYGFLNDRLLAERILRKWMDGWKNISGHDVVTIIIKLDDIEIITAQTAGFSGDDQVEFHR